MPPLTCTTPLSVAIALIGHASLIQMSGSLHRYSPSRQQLTLTDARGRAHAQLTIARASTAASSFEVLIGHVTTVRMQQHVLRLVRAFVRETQAPVTPILDTHAA